MRYGVFTSEIDRCLSGAVITRASGYLHLLYTDGVTEALSPHGAMFGVEGIEGSLTECTGYPQCAIGHITSSLQEHQADIRPNDDQTLIVMRVEENCGSGVA